MKKIQKDPFIAAILSFFISGAGQAYAGKMERGVGIFVAGVCIMMITLISSVFIFPLVCTMPLAFIFWIWNIYDAYKSVE